MTRHLVSLAAVGLAVIATATATVASADDTNSDRPVKSHRQLMRECEKKHRAEDGNASPEDLKKACAEEIKSYNNHPSATSPSKTPGT